MAALAEQSQLMPASPQPHLSHIQILMIWFDVGFRSQGLKLNFLAAIGS
jgi:hypothetical protein